MSAAVNSRRLWAPDRPQSVDPAPALINRPPSSSATSRPPFSSFSSFSSSISSSLSSAFGGGRHARTVSTTSAAGTGAGAPVRPASAAPPAQAKWHPRSSTPGPAPGHHPRPRHRSTSSASAAAAALQAGSNSPEAPLPPVPGLPVPAEDREPDDNAWRDAIRRAAKERYRVRIRVAHGEYQARIQAALASGGLNGSTVSKRRRDSVSSSSGGGNFGSVGSTGSSRRMSEEARLQAEYERMVSALRQEMDEEIREATEREEARRAGRPLPPMSLPRMREVLVEDDAQSSSNSASSGSLDDVSGEGEREEWLWRPEELGAAAQPGKWKDAVRQEQQVIWDAIKRGGTPPANSLLTAASRKVHFAAGASPSDELKPHAGSPGPLSSSPSSGQGKQPPTLPRTPHTPYLPPGSAPGMHHAPYRPPSSSQLNPNAHRPLTSLQTGANARSISPAVARPASASAPRPDSPGYSTYARWIPGSAAPSSVQAPTHARTASIPIPGRNVSTSNRYHNANSGATGDVGGGSAGSGRSVSGSGSWRDWTGPPGSNSAHGHGSVNAKDTSAPAAAAAPVVPPTRHSMTPASMVSSASGYAYRHHRAPSAPPVQTSNLTREVRRERERERERERSRATMPVVDDRETEPAFYATAAVPTTVAARMRPSASGMSRTSSGRSALVDEDAPAPPEPPVVPVERAPVQEDEEEEDEVIEEPPPPPRRDKGKGKARAPPEPEIMRRPRTSMAGGRHGGGMYAAQLDYFETMLRRDVRISAEA